MALLFGPGETAAQSGCERAAWRAPERVFGTVQAVRWYGGESLTFGEPFFEIVIDSTGRPSAGDTAWAGARFKADGSATLIRRPTGTIGFMSPRAIEVGSDRTLAVWAEPDTTVAPVLRRGRFTLRSSVWSTRGWVSLTTIGRFRAETDFSRGMASDLVAYGNARYFALATVDSARFVYTLALVTWRAGQWSVSLDTLPLRRTGAVALGATDAGLAAVVVGSSPAETSVAGQPTFSSVWFVRFDGSRWSRPLLLDGSGSAPVFEPQLLAARGGSIAAWIRRGVPELEWRLVKDDGRLGIIQRLAGVRSIVSGQEGHRDLLSVVMEDGTGRVLRLREEGYDEVGTYPARLGFVFPVGGEPQRPLAFVVDTTTRNGHVWPALSAYVIGCEAVRDRSPAPR